ncbi:hypothetical protein WR25_04669 [Diploscapter pachys]|uniref:Uncharacterized protein n=1 Tax=Diploscapter pachys TaxID=2018661 RepID=A0A2A2M2M7_9BILA|nr:hypothetical protein WR25_04669 [Diploscapter pachys]
MQPLQSRGVSADEHDRALRNAEPVRHQRKERRIRLAVDRCGGQSRGKMIFGASQTMPSSRTVQAGIGDASGRAVGQDRSGDRRQIDSIYVGQNAAERAVERLRQRIEPVVQRAHEIVRRVDDVEHDQQRQHELDHDDPPQHVEQDHDDLNQGKRDHAWAPDYGAVGQAWTNVPAPAEVKISSSIACGTRPSRITAASTPASTAATQVSTLGIIPPEIVPSAFSAVMPAGSRSVSSILSLSSTPATSVCPSAPRAIGATTGMMPLADSVSMIVRSTATGSPTKPRST